MERERIRGDVVDGAERGDAMARNDGLGGLRLRGVDQGRRRWVILLRLLIATVDIDDHHALPDKELLKAALNGLHGFAKFVGRIVASDTDEEVHFADAHKLAKQIVR